MGIPNLLGMLWEIFLYLHPESANGFTKRMGSFLVCLLAYLMLSVCSRGEDPVFPHRLPNEKPDIDLSSARSRT